MFLLRVFGVSMAWVAPLSLGGYCSSSKIQGICVTFCFTGRKQSLTTSNDGGSPKVQISVE